MKLVAIGGSLRGSSFRIGAGEFRIGRDLHSSLCIEDPAVSRAHCVLWTDDTGLWIRDLNSRNGVQVGGIRIKTAHHLTGGEEIRIGNSVFLLVDDERGDAATCDSDHGTVTSTSVLKLDASLYLEPKSLLQPTRTEREFALLLRLSTELAALASAEAFEQCLQRSIPGLLPCETVLIRFLDRAAAADSVERQAVATSSAVLEHAGTLAIPLRSAGRTVALIRVETGSGAMDDHHLQIAGAIGALASVALDSIQRVNVLRDEKRRLEIEVESRWGMVAESPRMFDVLRVVRRVAATPTTVLILGESGTGKELIARAIHRSSPRAEQPFVAVNCAALNPNLLESELFGHEKGAFTGAMSQRRGRIEAAEGGTLFLDEAGELAPYLQAKLLRVLQEREFERVGGIRTLQADIRVLAATNRNLEEAVREGSFRQDLYYRLNVMTLHVPPLRERREDIIPLAEMFAARCAERCGRHVTGLSPAAKACLIQYDWPGNVRELGNAVERAVVLGTSEYVEPHDLPDAVIESGLAASPGGFHAAVRNAKRKILLTAIAKAGGSHTKAAELLGLNPTYLSRLLRNLE